MRKKKTNLARERLEWGIPLAEGYLYSKDPVKEIKRSIKIMKSNLKKM